LWHAVIDHELQEYYQRLGNPHPDHGDPQGQFDEFVVRWIDEYNHRVIRVFFSQLIAYAEIDATVARIRDEVYESFFEHALQLVSALGIDACDEELEKRVLEMIVLLEGLQVVSAFRPAIVERDYAFRQRILQRANAIVRGA
jgi:hypothetical protein